MPNKVWGSKKATVTVYGAVGISLVGFLTLLLAALFPNIDSELIAKIAELLALALSFIVGTYNVGQGIADGKNNTP